MKFNEINLTTTSSLTDYESEINKLSGKRTVYAFSPISKITTGSEFYGFDFVLTNNNNDTYIGTVPMDGDITVQSEPFYTRLNILDENGDIIEYFIVENYVTTIAGVIDRTHTIQLGAVPIKTEILGSWQGKINASKRKLESLLNVHLSNLRSSANPNPVELINNAEVLKVASDLLTLSIIFRDLSMGDNDMYNSKASAYKKDFNDEFRNVLKSLDLSVNNNDTTDIYGYNPDNLLKRRTNKTLWGELW